VTDAEVIAALKEIRRLGKELSALDGDHLALRNRAIEIASTADVMLWSLAPDESEWLDAIYGEREDA
jgi:hypothetical protein